MNYKKLATDYAPVSDVGLVEGHDACGRRLPRQRFGSSLESTEI